MCAFYFKVNSKQTDAKNKAATKMALSIANILRAFIQHALLSYLSFFSFALISIIQLMPFD